MACVRVRDIARTELGSQDYSINAYLNNKNAVAIGIFQRPGSNALSTAEALQREMARMAETFPSGLGYSTVYNPTEFIQQSVNEVIKTLIEATLLVIVVVILFLQSWRAAIIPIIAIPVSLVGTFLVMAMVGVSFNTLSLFGSCWPSASSSMTRSWWWRMSSVTCARAIRRRMPRTRPWTKWAAR